jgi:N-acyl-D-aspartate/D-glutamate deacylase
MLDLVIRNAHIFDGSGMPGFRGEIGVRGNRIVQVGSVAARGTTEIDARGLAVAPGFIDPHTHYDAQLCWDGLAQPALEHGVTTVVTGNCSLTLAPLKVQDRGRLCRMFRQIEDLPMAAFDDGIDWTWESFEGYLASLKGKIGINIAPLVGHSAIRMWVMGEDAFHREATADEIGQMRELLRECLLAGASGLSTSYVDSDENYLPVPSRMANHEEIRSLAAVMGEVGHGILQIVPEFYDTSLMIHRVDELADISLDYGIPTTLSPLFESARTPELVGAVLGRVQQQAERGARVWPQVQTRPIDINFRLRERNFMLMAMPTWFRVLNQEGKAPKVAAFTDPETRKQLIAEALPQGEGLGAMRSRLENSYIRGVKLEKNRGLVGRKLGDIARERGVNAAEFMIDIALEEDLDTEFKNDSLGHTDVEVVGEMLAHNNVLIGASDAGAHVQAFATNGDTGYLFSKFVRESNALTTAQAVKKITHETALAWGLKDRGLINPGYGADLVIFDPETIARDEEVGVSDLPGEGFRYIRHAQGIDTVIVNGQPTYSAASGYTAARAGEVVTLSTPAAV